ncbi:MAG: hypothetical protein AAGJ52_01255 [Pseudomonadota bacterium]
MVRWIFSEAYLPSILVLSILVLCIQGAWAQTTLPGFFDESAGQLVIEAESIGVLPDDWRDQSSTTAPNVDEPAAATGSGFIVWDGNQSLNNPGNGLLVYPIRINTPGEYRFCWRSQVGNGTSPTDHNDSWLKIDADAFFGRKNNGSVVCPKGFDPEQNDCEGGEPNGSGREGWFKVYSSGTTDWTFSTRTSDNDAHEIYARFDVPGLYEIQVSARSSFHLLDRFTLSNALNCLQNLDLPESNYVDPRLIFGDRFETDGFDFPDG